jgi:predicted CoA-binding protein
MNTDESRNDDKRESHEITRDAKKPAWEIIPVNEWKQE